MAKAADAAMSAVPAAPIGTVHATAVVIGETGVLIRGVSGSGKSTLARQLLERAARAGRFARLVGDDRVALVRAHGRIVVHAVPAIAGLLEVRGVGIVAVPFLPSAVVGLVVDSDVTPERLPEPCDKVTDILDTRMPRLAVAGVPDAADIVFSLVAQRQSTSV